MTTVAVDQVKELHLTVTRECPYHGMHLGHYCQQCADEIANGGPVRRIATIMSASLESLAARL